MRSEVGRHFDVADADRGEGVDHRAAAVGADLGCSNPPACPIVV
jgi:hypothetical protein